MADREAIETLRVHTGSEVEPLDGKYQAFLDRVKVMSNTLNNEIQLVIGAVTVQVLQAKHTFERYGG